jgi:hypothetical protein
MPAAHELLGAFCHGMMFPKAKWNEKIRMITKYFRENANPR